ncbi:MAG TPA: dTDP-4-dehydrorhamnose 3,5-epimerase [Deltaproteobacteria bacterium]|nr:dTDP-4-dehydrorhamnose 3,5-epimerase [Deltaproteobacteria bacterium]
MEKRFTIKATPLQGLTVIQRTSVSDERGFLSRLYCADEFSQAGLGKPVVQINHTLTRKKGTARGLHFQHPPNAEWKIITCLRGAIFDVAVDIRKESPSFLRWHGEILTADNLKSLSIPEGFAHGFQALADDCELLYFHTASFEPRAEGALNVNDPLIGIEWPLPITELSDRDKSHPFLQPDFQGISP